MSSRRGRHAHGIKAHKESPHRKSPIKSGWRLKNKEKARTRRLERQKIIVAD
ncbi:MAG: hypothetical protein UR28_C0021G0041 [Candidatus Peregrinibacteria bacterium GW2011_GWF2_33_10]|nr:MAG: hypothetical protein UR28_C0021G0041 [Candidatus Peregrinibacteria bacterium GW2011_GWF2_33_10]